MSIKDTLLNEKITSQEFSDVLRDPNIFVGAEWEFIVQKFEDDYKSKFDKFDLYNRYSQELELYEDELEKAEDESDGDISDEILSQLPIPQFAIDLGYEAGEEIPEILQLFPDLKVKHKKMFKKLISDYLPLDKFPFKDYIASNNNKETSATKWVVKPDGSLGLAGVEIVCPPMPLQEFLQVCPLMFKAIKDTPGVDVSNSCGFHISISLKNINNLNDKLDIVKLALFTDEGMIYKFFDMREFNQYARSAHTSATQHLVKTQQPELIDRLVDVNALKKGFANSHYEAINIEHIEKGNKNQYIEFRYVGGANYHMKWSRIRHIIIHYAYNLALACDDKFKYKEYVLKLQRILNKLFLFMCTAELNRLMADNPKAYLQPIFKELLKQWNAYKFYYEDAKKDPDAMKQFGKLCLTLGLNNPDDIIWDWNEYLKRIK